MSFLEGAYSQVVAALQRQGRPNFRASDVPTGDREHSWVPGAPGGGNLMGPQVAQAIAQPNAFMTHRGSLQLIGGLPRESRGYSPHTGSSALRPMLPTADPAITRAILTVTNADEGTANLMGEQGYAVHVQEGVARFDGPLWGGRWAKVDAVGNFTDTRAGELGAGVDSLYYYADATIVGDSKGRNLTDIPTRIFYQRESDLPAVGSVVFEGMRDQYGVGWGPDKGQMQFGAGKISTGWSWVTGQENVLGRISFNPTTAIYNGTPDTTRTYSALAPSGPGTDPNGQKDTVFGYSWGPSGARIAVTANVYDEKIGSVKPWLGGLDSIPGGWALITSSTEGAGRYLIGYAAGGDYDTPGDDTLGRHPIRPIEHASTAVSTEDAGVTIESHAAADVTTSTTHITVADHAASDVTSSTTHITVDAHASTSVSDETVVVAAHPDHKHPGTDDGWFISTLAGKGGVSEPNTPVTDSNGDTMAVEWFCKVGFDSDTWVSGIQCISTSTALTLTHSVTAHHHTTPVLEHSVVDPGHHHTTPVFSHVITDPGHHHSTPVLVHDITNSGVHFHTTPVLIHAEEDFRSPGVVLVMIKRVGPDDD